jgi:hypothetical protein
MAYQTDQPKNRSRAWSVFLNWINSLGKPQSSREVSGRISISTDGFSVSSNESFCWSLKWDEITRVVAFKRDLFNTDLICFGFQHFDRQDAVWCIHEEMLGFKEFVVDLERATDGAWPDRFQNIAHPAFEQCWTELWKAESAVPLDENPSLIWIRPPECSQD